MQSLLPHQTIIRIDIAKQRLLECQMDVGVIAGFGSAILVEMSPNLSFDFVLLERQLCTSGSLSVERYQPFSLLNRPHDFQPQHPKVSPR